MTVMGEQETTAGQVRVCPHCGDIAHGGRYCPECGHAIDAIQDPSDAPVLDANGLGVPPGVGAPSYANGSASSPPGPPPGVAPGSAPSRPRRVWFAAAGVICLAAIAVATVVVLSRSSSSQGSAYRQKLQTALAPVVSANSALSSALQSLQGSKTSSAASATSRAQQATVAARGAVQILTVPSGFTQLSQQVQQALTDESGYLQAVSSTLSHPSSANVAQLQPLATGVQSAFVPLASIAPSATTSLGGNDHLSIWASDRVAAAAKANAAQQKASQQRAVKQAASKAAQQAVASNNSSSSTNSTSVAGLGVQDLPVQCGYGVAGSAGMSCTFANNAFYEYWLASGGNPSFVEYITAWSPQDQTYYALSCFPGDGVIDCTGTSNSGASLDARFTPGSQLAYSSSQAAAYAASGKPGPNG